MVWATAQYLPILNEAFEKWNNAKKKEREEVVADTVKRVRGAYSEALKTRKVQGLPGDLATEIWFKNTKQKSSHKTPGQFLTNKRNAEKSGEASEDPRDDADVTKDKSIWGKQWNARLVAGRVYKDVVLEEHNRLMGNGQTNFAAYQPALTKVMNGLTEEQYNQCAEQAKAWNVGPWPVDLQQEAAEKDLYKVVQTFIADVQRKMGVRLFLLTSYVDKEGNAICSKFDTKDGDRQFSTEYKDWKTNKIWDTWCQYGASFTPENQQGSKSWAILDRNEEDYPLLPERPQDAALPEMKSVVREFVKAVHLHQKGTSHVPWAKIQADPGTLILDGVPSHLTLKEPSYMNRPEVLGIYDYWYGKQCHDTEPLSFIDPVDRPPVNHTGRKASNVRFSKSEETNDDSGDGSEGTLEKPRRKGKGKELEPSDRSPAAARNHQTYLQSLVKNPAYRKALRILDYSGPQTSVSCSHLPSWCTWTYADPYLPESFFVLGKDSDNHWSSFAKWLKKLPWEGNRPNSMPPRAFVELILLGLGLALRDLDFAMFTDPDEIPDDCPSYVSIEDITAYDALDDAAKALDAAFTRYTHQAMLGPPVPVKSAPGRSEVSSQLEEQAPFEKTQSSTEPPPAIPSQPEERALPKNIQPSTEPPPAIPSQPEERAPPKNKQLSTEPPPVIPSQPEEQAPREKTQSSTKPPPAIPSQAAKAQSKINFPVTILPKRMQRIVPRLGMNVGVIEFLGPEWKNLCQSWIHAEAALTKLGGVVFALEERQAPVPNSLIEWVKSAHSKESTSVKFSSIASDMPLWCNKILPEGKVEVEDIVKADWCIGGFSGIVLILVGMREWGMTAKDEPQWIQMVHKFTNIFQGIPNAKALMRSLRTQVQSKSGNPDGPAVRATKRRKVD